MKLLTGLTGRRTGPPTRAEAPSLVRSFRFSPAEDLRLRQAARMHFTTPSDFVRSVVLLEVDDMLEDDGMSEPPLRNT